MKTIKLKCRQYEFDCLVSDEDYPMLSEYKWYLKFDCDNFYVYTYITENNKSKVLLIHRLLMKPPKDMVVDHINCDGLDNRRENLRVVTKRENTFNKLKKENTGTSKYKGVSFDKNKNFVLIFSVNNISKYYGTYAHEEENAIAYDLLCKHYRGDIARLNFNHIDYWKYMKDNDFKCKDTKELKKLAKLIFLDQFKVDRYIEPRELRKNRKGKFRRVPKNKVLPKGITYTDYGDYHARIYAGSNRSKSLGVFRDLEEAKEAYKKAHIEKYGIDPYDKCYKGSDEGLETVE